MVDVDWNSDCAEPIRPSDTHYVLVEWPISLTEAGIPRPQPGKYHWNSSFVRLPCHPDSKIPVEDSNGEKLLTSRWDLIRKAFVKKISSSQELEDAILLYNPKFKDKWKFRALHNMFESDFDEEETRQFFDNLLPKIIDLALQLPELVQWSIPMVRQTQNFSVSLSQQQIACLVANAFLCTFPMRNNNIKAGEYSTWGDINFTRMFQGAGNAITQKILCICHYFRTVTDKPRSGMVTFTRRCVTTENFPKWETLDQELGTTELRVSSTGTIEDSHGMLQADFANRYLGGGVLGHGCVQEEIRFVICPELIASKLFMECLKPNEAVWIVGCERFSNYTGYASTFQWSGPYEDQTPNDTSWRKKTTVVAIDALRFRHSSHQFREELMLRELNKAFVGFHHDLTTPPPPIASGNWGCGAYGGEPQLKSLLQLIVCTAVNRTLVYYTFNNNELKENIEKMYKFLQRNSITVSLLWSYLRAFSQHNLKPDELFSFVYQCFYDGVPVPESSKSAQKPITSFFKPLPKPVARTTEQEELDRYTEYVAREMEKEDETVEDTEKMEIDTQESVRLEVESSQEDEKPRPKMMSLNDALNSDYYEAAPSKKHCTDETQLEDAMT